MPAYMKALGRVAGKALKSEVVERTITVAAGYVLSEMRLVDVRARRMFLNKKRDNHLNILGRTWYRLHENGIDSIADERIQVIVRVLEEIDSEIEAVNSELARRKAYESERRRYQRTSRTDHESGGHNQSERGGRGRR